MNRWIDYVEGKEETYPQDEGLYWIRFFDKRGFSHVTQEYYWVADGWATDKAVVAYMKIGSAQ